MSTNLVRRSLFSLPKRTYTDLLYGVEPYLLIASISSRVYRAHLLSFLPFLSSIEQEEERNWKMILSAIFQPLVYISPSSSRFLSVWRIIERMIHFDLSFKNSTSKHEPPIPDKQTSLYSKHLESLSRIDEKGEARKIRGGTREWNVSFDIPTPCKREERGERALCEGATFRRWWNVTRQTDILPRHLLPLFLLLLRALYARAVHP